MLNYGEALKYQREIRGLSQSELAQKTGLKQQTISWSETNKGLPNIDFAYSLPIFTVSLWTNSSGATKEEKCPRNNINKDRRSGLFRYPFTCVTITQIINPARMIPPRISRIFRAFFRPWAHILCIRTSDTPRFPFPRRIFGSAWFRDCPKDFYFLSAYSFPSRFLFSFLL